MAYAGRLKPVTRKQAVLTEPLSQPWSTGLTATAGASTAMVSLSSLKANTCVPPALETTVVAPGTPIVEMVEFEARFITTTAPAGERIPATEAVGTAVNASVPLPVGITMLVVAPGSPIDPAVDSVVVFTTATLLVPESKTITVARLAEIAISPGLVKVPAPIPATRGRVSL